MYTGISTPIYKHIDTDIRGIADYCNDYNRIYEAHPRVSV